MHAPLKICSFAAVPVSRDGAGWRKLSFLTDHIKRQIF
jgi:hypothetical protein